ncbi:MAG: hypothetical protein ABIC82_00100 [bacterium]
MFKKVVSCLAVLLVALFFSLSVAQSATVGFGDAVFRDMDSWYMALWLVGHTGIYIGGGKVVHMQGSGCEKADMSNFTNTRYWGSFYSGNYFAAKNRVDEANTFLSPKAIYDFWSYKNFSGNSPKGRCDGLVEHCFEKFGANVVNDYHWSTLTPQTQWRSNKISRRYTTSRGKTAYNTDVIPLIPGIFE